MGISYRPLKITLAEQNIKLTQLKSMINCSPTTIAKINKNESLNLKIIEDICRALNVPVEKVIEFIE